MFIDMSNRLRLVEDADAEEIEEPVVDTLNAEVTEDRSPILLKRKT